MHLSPEERSAIKVAITLLDVRLRKAVAFKRAALLRHRTWLKVTLGGA